MYIVIEWDEFVIPPKILNTFGPFHDHESAYRWVKAIKERQCFKIKYLNHVT